MNQKVLVICGPTASGKSKLAHEIAKISGGEIINCDSMQIYKEIPIITASPSDEEKLELPYHLYNFLSVTEEFSVDKYVKLATKKIEEVSAANKLAIIVGGTGMYINSLVYGYSQMPTISPDIRNYTRGLNEELGQEKFFEELVKIDPLSGARLNVLDKQRAIRAFEVFKQTGKSIFYFQEHLKESPPLEKLQLDIIFLHPERSFLYETCDARLTVLFESGAIEEVREMQNIYPISSRNLHSSPYKAVGVYEIMEYLNGKVTLQQALTSAQNRTRQYAKRQITWFKNQIKEKLEFNYSSAREFDNIISKILEKFR